VIDLRWSAAEWLFRKRVRRGEENSGYHCRVTSVGEGSVVMLRSCI